MKQFTVVGAVLVLTLFGLAYTQPPETPVPGDAAPDVAEDPRQEMVKSAEAFDAAYNAHDVEALAAFFTERAEYTDEDGTIEGRDAIREAFTEVFAASPEVTLQTSVESVTFPSPGVAIEEGRTFSSSGPDEPEVERLYVVVHSRDGDGWKIASIREDTTATLLTPAEALEPLAWLVGDWVDESDDSRVESSCRWSEDGNWLLQEYVVHLAGGPAMSGSQRIGWDASRKQVRSWSFDSEGGHLEAIWTFDGERWIAQAQGVAADGATGSGTRVLTPLGTDAYLLQSFHRVFDGESLPDSAVTVVRRPPGVETADDASQEDAEPINEDQPANDPETPESN